MNEFELIDYLTNDFKIYQENVVAGIGDDCAVWREGDKYIVFTTDTMVEGDHFLKSWFTPEQIGQRLVETNVSDVASMGAIPTSMFVSLVIDDNTSPLWCRKMYDGIKRVADKYKISLLGGNITHGKTLSLTLGVHGETITNLVYRKGSTMGDLIVVTGTIGDACIARLMLGKGLTVPTALFNRLATPTARVDDAQIIKQYASAMIDISDGIASEARHIAKASQLGVLINATDIPYSSLAKKHEKDIDRSLLECALRGGEDYELMFSISEENFNKLQKHKDLISPLTVIGCITKEMTNVYIENDVVHDLPKGFDHFNENINL
ncbi:MAG: thiamine-phosphate kinase [Candidatus Margulisbacteria bacterium GWF2_35_9]|nr:MAG: thiamine-phosphate kinase [Candidatus Margulisbacteria bacterium GWF2_35_9]